MRKNVVIAFTIPAVIFGLSVSQKETAAVAYHTPAQKTFFRQHKDWLLHSMAQSSALTNQLPIDSFILFPIAKNCGGCHGFDSLRRALVTTSGEDVNMYDDWRSSIMANSARDPFWRAKVSHESLVNPVHSAVLQDKCTTCHAPAGNLQAKWRGGKAYYTLADLERDSLGLDGVTCQICHAQSPDAAIGNLHSGAMAFDINKIRMAYGPYEMIFAGPMRDFVGITPAYGEHIGDGGLCAGCHSLITHSTDLSGHPTGNTFVEQATYHEWLNSRFDEDHDNISCQGCHMPQLLDEIIISGGYQFLTPRFPYGLHELVGGNVTMLQILKQHRHTLGISALPEHFDSTIVATVRQLQRKTLQLQLEAQKTSGDTAIFSLRLTNLAGHKFPSGYPARRAWVEFYVQNEQGDVLFHSGRMRPDGTLPDEDAHFEPHHHIIRSPQQVQIYEMVAGDVQQQYTTVLERMHTMLKDNRLVPQGFSSSDPVYDTTQIVGHAATDPDFNFSDAGDEGSGSDKIHFHVATHGYQGRVSVTAKVWYQSIPPKFLKPMWAFSSPEIDVFRDIWQTTDPAPVLVGEVQSDSIYLTTSKTQDTDLQDLIRIFPQPAHEAKVWIQTSPAVELRSIRIFDAAGRWNNDLPVRPTFPHRFPVELPPHAGVYFLELHTSRGRVLKKVVQIR